ncbi:MAG TPA: BspA family leucine-rich repeat surface protein, partial [Gallicola sp.]|nr:BspA family leucine-rich repeat surface protein [Gallicola sp.]
KEEVYNKLLELNITDKNKRKQHIKYAQQTKKQKDINSTNKCPKCRGELVERTSMSRMFGGCTNLTILDISQLITTNVSQMYGMFQGCRGLTSFDLSTFDTSKVTTMAGMFSGCISLTFLDLSMFITTSLTETGSWWSGGMFSGCTSLTNIDLSSFNTSKVTDMREMFKGCGGLTSLDLSTFVTNVLTITGGTTTGTGMFEDCTNLINIDLRNANFTTVTTYGRMFFNITNGITIIVKDATTQTWINARLTDVGKTGTVTIY